METRKMNQTPAEQAEEENRRALIEKQKRTIENQKVMIQYLAAMTDVYIPEETEEEEEMENVQNSVENEENV